MKSYDDFWDNLVVFDNNSLSKYNDYLLNKCRSSTIFPVYKNKTSTTRLEFLSYWLKKHGNNVVMRLTARNLSGKVLSSKLETIISYRAITIDAAAEFEGFNNGFCGSIEVEIFSKTPPLYPFPAITLSFHSKTSNSVVHSCIRTYNSEETIADYVMRLPQTGFDVILNKGQRNYICFFGGNSKCYTLRVALTEGSLVIKKSVLLNNNHYSQTHLMYIEDVFTSMELKGFSQPKVSIEHDLDDVFPRFYTGIQNGDYVPTLTHTFFDTALVPEEKQSNTQVNLRAVNNNATEYFDSAFMIPIYPIESFNTSLRSYSQNLKFLGEVQLRFYSNNGELLNSRFLEENEVELLNKVSEFDIDKEVLSCDLPPNSSCSMFLGFVDPENPFPNRFKLGLNVKRKNAVLGSNICFAPLVVQTETLLKPFSRKWFPLGGREKFIASIHNTDLLIKGAIDLGKFGLEFINNDGEVLKRDINMKSNGSLFLDIDKDDELKVFFNKDVGWCMVTANNYLVDAYYFATNGLQIGGDHAY